jgi:hypothetical protein
VTGRDGLTAVFFEAGRRTVGEAAESSGIATSLLALIDAPRRAAAAAAAAAMGAQRATSLYRESTI